MKIIENTRELEDFLVKIKKNGQKIGLIPTMGSIHKGHLSLIQACQKLGYFSVVTIFVNPTQFNDQDDFDIYPREIDNDKKILKNINTNLLFLPASSDLYPNGIKSKKTIFEYRDILCDSYRPKHFDGVTTVINSLLNLVKPNHVFFGEKDFQQLKIIQSMIDNYFSIVLHSCPSIRMKNGMSFSSRYNKFSTLEENIFNQVANFLKISIEDLRNNFNINIMISIKKGLKDIGIKKIDYVELKDEINLQSTLKKKNSRLFIAFYIGKIRIIDNFILY